MKTVLDYKTIFLSDVHLGFTDCKIGEVNHFLKHTRCQKLVLNGDIIDGWHLKKFGKWKKEHTKFFRLVLKKVEKESTEVVYTRGNHDDFLWSVLPLEFGGIQLVNEHIHQIGEKRYIIVHGDGFDAVTTNHPWIAKVGSMAYSFLLLINRVYNWAREKMGKPYYSLSKKIKAKVKGAVSFVGRYEEQLQSLARENKCDGIICGHIHTPADKQIDDIHYLNCGDWVESLTAIVEHYDGRLELISYEEFCARLDDKAGVREVGNQEEDEGTETSASEERSRPTASPAAGESQAGLLGST